MPITAAVAIPAALSAGSTALDFGQSKANMKRTAENNRQERQFALDMYFQQRTDALRDWRRENTYNSPEQQMQRLKEAGLNPHLIYGNGADATSGSIRSSNASTPSTVAPQATFDSSSLSTAFAAYQDAQIRDIRTDNLKYLNELTIAETEKKRVETANAATEGEASKFALDQAKALKDSTLEAARLRNEKLQADIENIGFSQNMQVSKFNQHQIEVELKKQEVALKQAKTSADIRKIDEEILRSVMIREENNPIYKERMEAEIQKILNSNALQSLHYQLLNLGLQSGSPEYIKRYTSVLRDILSSIPQPR